MISAKDMIGHATEEYLMVLNFIRCDEQVTKTVRDIGVIDTMTESVRKILETQYQ